MHFLFRLILFFYVWGIFTAQGQKAEETTEEVKIEETLPVTPNVTEVSAMNAEDGDGKININTADAALLETLPGIGPVLAQRIVDYRQTYGLFRTVDEIKDVSGIGDATFAEIDPLFCVCFRSPVQSV